MKKFNLLLLLSLANVLTAKDHHIKLENPIIHALDGVTSAFDGNTIAGIMDVRKKLHVLHLGELDKETKKRVGSFVLNGKKYSIHELAIIEKKAIESNDTSKLQELNQLLNEAKREFLKMTEPFMESTRSAKKQVCELIKESCQKRNRMSSFILTWSELTNNEDQFFNNNIRSFAQLDEFLTHILDFLGDLTYSCPKGYKQFRIWYCGEK